MKLTIAQRSVYDAEKSVGGSISVMCGIMTVERVYPKEDVVAAIREIYRTNDALNLRLDETGPEPELRPFPWEDRKIPVIEVSDPEELDRYGREAATTPFDLRGPLSDLRAVVWPGGYGILLRVHHLLGDAWSMSLIGTQLNELLEGKPSPRYSYTEYANEEAAYIGSPRYLKDRDFFLQSFDASPSPVLFCRDDRNYGASAVRLPAVTEEMRAQLASALEGTEVSEFSYLFGLFSLLYAKYNGCPERFFLGMPVLGRVSNRSLRTVGMFTNTAPVPVSLDYNASLKENLIHIADSILSVFRHQRFNYSETLRALRESRQFDGPLYDTLINFQADEILSDYPMVSKEYSKEMLTDSIQLQFNHRNGETGLVVDYFYRTSLFSEAEVLRLHEALMHTVRVFLRSPDLPLKDLCLLPEGERGGYRALNGAVVPYNRQKNVYTLFEEQAILHGDETAVISPDRTLTYKELLEEAGRLAAGLKAKGLGTGDIVSVELPRDPRAVCAVLGVLKTGAAYLPVDTALPEARKAFMLRDSGAKLRVTEDRYQSLLADSPLNNTANVLPNDICYVIYTSGSTGTPKGVCVSHGNLNNYLCSVRSVYGRQCMPLFTSLAVDLTVTSLFLPLITGGTVTCYDGDFASVLPRLASDGGITALKATPTHIKLLLSEEHNGNSNLRTLILGGEALYGDTVNACFARFGNKIEIHNEYGPTEATVGCMDYVCTAADGPGPVPIGRPTANTRIYLLDPYMQPVPPGVTGEICIAGDSVAPGYLRRPDLTAQAFVPDPFGEGMLYRTGDLAYRIGDGDLVYVGRGDAQIKLHGQRVEPGEIEAALTALDGVESAAVLLQTDASGKETLRAFYTGKKTSADVLRSALAGQLPPYMLPHSFRHMEALPLTSGGKTDRKALENESADTEESVFEAPVTDQEKALAEAIAAVLGTGPVGRNDRFFALGGDSIRAIHVVSRLQKAGFELPAADLLREAALSQTAKRMRAASSAPGAPEERPFAEPSLLSEERQELRRLYGDALADAYPLSPAQEGIYAQSARYGGKHVYHLQQLLRAPSPDIEEIRKRAYRLTERHSALRTAFVPMRSSGRILQAVLKERPPVFRVTDVGKTYSSEAAALYLRSDAEQPFDLQNDPLLRVNVLSFTDTTLILCAAHHIVTDGWSMALLAEELFETNEQNETVSFSRYVRSLESTDRQSAVSHWQKLLDGAVPTRLFAGRRSGVNASAAADAEETVIQPHGVEQAAKYAGVTVNTVFETAFGILLQRYSGSVDAVFCKAVSGRTGAAGAEYTVGPFLNTVPVRISRRRGETGTEALKSAQEQNIGAQLYGVLQLGEAFALAGADADQTDALFAFENYYYSAAQEKAVEDLRRNVLLYREQTEFPLTATVQKLDGAYLTRFVYDPAAFTKPQIRAMAESYADILTRLSEDTDAPLDTLGVPTGLDPRGYNGTEVPVDKTKNTYTLFEEQAILHGDETAVISPDRTLTYKELLEEAGRLAAGLKAKGLGTGDIVSVELPRDPRAVCAVLGVLKTGAAYLPVDTALPEARKAFMLRDSGAKLRVTEDRYQSLLADSPLNNTANVLPNDICYVIYTSGSTGTPKGVCVSHGNLNNYLCSVRSVYGRQCMPLFTSLAVDLTVTSLFLPLITGGTVTCYDGDFASVLPRLASDGGITALKATPTHIKLLLSEEHNGNSNLRTLILGGEALYGDTVNACFARFGNKIEIHNEYGPTEATVGCMDYVCTAADGPGPVPIGRPTANTRIYLLDPYMQPVPPGVTGEICIAGDSVAPGYLRRPDLTAQAFVPDPFGEGMLYRTGDLAYRIGDGDLVYVGRGDAQIKLHGQRVEPGEIEAALTALDGVESAAVLLQTDASGKETLRAFYTGKKTSADVLRSALAGQLPPYMLPHSFRHMEALPLTSGGKTDRKALENESADTEESVFEAPVTDQEKALAEAIAAVLGTGPVGRNDRFFALGGDSIRAVHVAARLQKAGYELSAADLLREAAVKDAAAHMKPVAAFLPADADSPSDVIPLPPIARAYLHDAPHSPARFMQSCILTLPYPIATVTDGLLELSSRHELLRAVLRGDALQILSENEFRTRFSADIPPLTDPADEAQAIRVLTARDVSFSLSGGLLIDAAGCETKRGCVLRLSLHHYIVDLFSWEILLEDLRGILTGLAGGIPADLPEKTAGYGAHIRALGEYAADMPPEETAYWMRLEAQLGRVTPLCAITDPLCSAEADDVTLPNDVSDALIRLEQRGEARLDALLLTAVAAAATGIAGGNAGICVESHGRVQLPGGVPIDRTVGWFTSVYPAVFPALSPDADGLFCVKRILQNVPNCGIGWLLRQGTLPRNADIIYNFYRYRDAQTAHARPVYEAGASSLEALFPKKLSVDCEFRDGVIHAHFRAPGTHRPAGLLRALANGFVSAARSLALLADSAGGKTEPADSYSDAELTRGELAELESLFNGVDENAQD